MVQPGWTHGVQHSREYQLSVYAVDGPKCDAHVDREREREAEQGVLGFTNQRDSLRPSLVGAEEVI